MKSIFWGRDGKDEFLCVFIITSVPKISKVSFHQPVKEQTFPSQACHVILYTSQGEALGNSTGGTFV